MYKNRILEYGGIMLERKGKVTMKDNFRKGGREINYEILDEKNETTMVCESFEEFLQKKEEILKKEKEIIIKNLNGYKRINFIIVNSEEMLIESYKIMNEKISSLGNKRYSLILNCEKLDPLFLTSKDCSDFIFIKNFDLSSYSKNGLVIKFYNCIFLKEIRVSNFKIYSLFFGNCIFMEYLSFLKISLEKLDFDMCDLKKGIIIRFSDIEKIGFVFNKIKNFNFVKNKVKKELNITELRGVENFELEDSRFFGEVSLNKIIGSRGSQLTFNDIIFDSINLNCKKIENIKFKRIKIIYFSKINIDELYDKKYKILEIFDKEELNLEKTIENIESLLWINEIKENTEMYLDLTYLQKKYERKLLFKKFIDRKKFKYLLKCLGSWILEISTKYFTCWKRCLLSILYTNLIFTSLYFINIESIKFSIRDMNVFKEIKECLYFSLITFSTIGYGDISPINDLKLLAAFEGLLGIFFTSAFVICLTRKYVK